MTLIPDTRQLSAVVVNKPVGTAFTSLASHLGDPKFAFLVWNMSPTFGTPREICPQWKPQIANYEEFIKNCWSSKRKGRFLAGQGSSFHGSCFASSSSSSPEPVYFSARTVGRWVESHQITSRVFLCWKLMPWICHFPGPAWHEIMGFRPVCVGFRRQNMQCSIRFLFWDLP